MTTKEAREMPYRPDANAPKAEYVGLSTDPVTRQGPEFIRREKSAETCREKFGYHEFKPCLDCTYCLIVRELRVGQIVNCGFFCTYGRFNCSPYGTCMAAHVGKRGPIVIVKKLNGDEPKTDFSNFEVPSSEEAARIELSQIKAEGSPQTEGE